MNDFAAFMRYPNIEGKAMKTAEDKNSIELAERDTAAECCILRLKNGDLDALKELYSLASASIYSYALSVLGSRHDAEDVLHDCIVKIYAQAKSYKPQGKPFAWIIRIAKNICIDRMRLRKKEAASSLDNEADTLPVDPIADAEDRLMIQSFLSALSPEERQIVSLHLISGFTFREIAKALGQPAPTVMTKYRRALIKLRKEYEGKELW